MDLKNISSATGHWCAPEENTHLSEPEFPHTNKAHVMRTITTQFWAVLSSTCVKHPGQPWNNGAP